MEKSKSIVFDIIGLFVKIFVAAALIVMLLQYTAINILALKVMSKAESNGYLDKTLYNELVSNLSFNISKIEVLEADPPWNTKVSKLGDPLKLVIRNKYTIKMFGQDLEFEMRIHKDGTNQGYYGAGY
jgi:hypothetical protein